MSSRYTIDNLVRFGNDENASGNDIVVDPIWHENKTPAGGQVSQRDPNSAFLASTLLLLSPQFSVLGSQFSVLSSPFSVLGLGSYFCVLSSQFSVFISRPSILRSHFPVLTPRFSTLISQLSTPQAQGKQLADGDVGGVEGELRAQPVFRQLGIVTYVISHITYDPSKGFPDLLTFSCRRNIP